MCIRWIYSHNITENCTNNKLIILRREAIVYSITQPSTNVVPPRSGGLVKRVSGHLGVGFGVDSCYMIGVQRCIAFMRVDAHAYRLFTHFKGKCMCDVSMCVSECLVFAYINLYKDVWSAWMPIYYTVLIHDIMLI